MTHLSSTLVLLLAGSLVLSAQSPAPARDHAALTRTVRAREEAFARTMAERDHAAFTAFLSTEAVFAGATILRGRERVAAAWRRYFEGPTAPFSWAPDLVEVLDSGRLALTSGPVTGADGKPAGRFNSIWRLEDDGVWRIVFDRGGS